MTLILCTSCFLIGGISRFCFVGLTAAERRIKLLAVSLILDFIWGFMTIAAIMCVIFVFNKGITMPFMLISALLGFAITAIFI